MTRFALEPIYGSILLAVAIAVAVIAVIAMVTPPSPNRSHRRWLIMLRSLAALMLLLAAFRPAFLRTDNRPAEATLIVAVDKSRSMTLPDGDGNDRWSSQVESWRELASGLADLDDSLSIRLLVYDKVARNRVDTGPEALDVETPDGELTDLAAATLAAIQAAGGKPIAGVVLMGDGTQTAPIQGGGARRVVETLRSLGVPLWCVPFGPAGGAAVSRDVAVEALPDSYQLFTGNEVAIEFQVHTRGVAGIDIPVTISWIDSQGRVSEVATRTVTATRSIDVQPFSIPIVAPAPGSYRLKVEAQSQSGELITVNNQQIAFADVRAGGGRILYLEGTPRPEQKFLRRSLRGFPDLDLTYRWIPRDTASRWPIDLDNYFQPGRFDVYIIGDLDSAAVGKTQWGMLAEAVSEGAGLVMLGGYQTYGSGGYATSALADVMPVRMDASRRRDASSQRDDSNGHLQGPIPIRLTRTHDITDLGGDDPARRWQQLPPQLGGNDFVGPKVAPGVQVLLESPDQQPLLIVGEYGSGRTAALAIDSTWRWWRYGKRDVHQRFWRQLVLWLLSRENTSGDKIHIELDSRRFNTAATPEFRARVQSVGESDRSIELIAEVVDESGAAMPVPASSDGSDENVAAIQGQLPKLAPGFYRLRVRAADDGGSLEAAEVAFQTIDQSREMDRPMADPVFLRQLAQLTADHGGTSFEPDEMNVLIDTIAKRRHKAAAPIVEKFRLGDGPLSGWIVFALFASALCGEWYLRRRWGLA